MQSTTKLSHQKSLNASAKVFVPRRKATPYQGEAGPSGAANSANAARRIRARDRRLLRTVAKKTRKLALLLTSGEELIKLNRTLGKKNVEYSEACAINRIGLHQKNSQRLHQLSVERIKLSAELRPARVEISKTETAPGLQPVVKEKASAPLPKKVEPTPVKKEPPVKKEQPKKVQKPQAAKPIIASKQDPEKIRKLENSKRICKLRERDGSSPLPKGIPSKFTEDMTIGLEYGCEVSSFYEAHNNLDTLRLLYRGQNEGWICGQLTVKSYEKLKEEYMEFLVSVRGGSEIPT